MDGFLQQNCNDATPELVTLFHDPRPVWDTQSFNHSFIYKESK